MCKILQKFGIYTLDDLITYFPREYEDRSNPKHISELENGEEALISAYPVGRIKLQGVSSQLEKLDKLKSEFDLEVEKYKKECRGE